MRGTEEFVFALFLVIALIAVPWTLFALASLGSGFPRLRLHQVLGIVGVSAWVSAFFAASGQYGIGWLVFATVVLVLLAFAGMWTREFRLLMHRKPDEFPGPHDKLVWAFALIAIAPAGVWLYRSFRKARWPEVEAAPLPHPLDQPEPDAG